MSKAFCRYPGGKSRHTDKILRYFNANELDYREPFIGGGSVFLRSGFENAWINDLDPGVYDMWRMVKETPGELIDLINEYTPIITHENDPDRIKTAIQTWRDIKDDKEHLKVPAGFRSLFLIKTCFSGVITGGPTGGIDQRSKYTLTARWAKDETIKRIRSATKRLQSCRITNYDWEVLVKEIGKNACIYLDPPYLNKGDQCYAFAFTLEDHQRLAKLVSESGHRYVVTLDDCPEIRNIWNKYLPEKCLISETWLYSMSDFRENNRDGRELFIIDEETESKHKKIKRTMVPIEEQT